MSSFIGRRAKTAPSQYPRLPFHGIRAFQLLSSAIVGGIMCFFLYYLTHDHWGIPWTFTWLSAASLFSVVALACTMTMHCFTGLNPKINLGLNSGLVVLWALSWSLLTWYMSGTLRNQCDIEHWREDAGIMVCGLYKTLFTFTLTGLVSTIAALLLDIYVFRKHTQRGVYQLHDLADGKRAHDGARVPFRDQGAAYGNGGLRAERRVSEAWEAPRSFNGGVDEDSDSDDDHHDHAARRGYTAPPLADHFTDDTEYGGPAHEIRETA